MFSVVALSMQHKRVFQNANQDLKTHRRTCFLRRGFIYHKNTNTGFTTHIKISKHIGVPVFSFAAFSFGRTCTAASAAPLPSVCMTLCHWPDTPLRNDPTGGIASATEISNVFLRLLAAFLIVTLSLVILRISPTQPFLASAAHCPT